MGGNQMYPDFNMNVPQPHMPNYDNSGNQFNYPQAPEIPKPEMGNPDMPPAEQKND